MKQAYALPVRNSQFVSGRQIHLRRHIGVFTQVETGKQDDKEPAIVVENGEAIIHYREAAELAFHILSSRKLARPNRVLNIFAVGADDIVVVVRPGSGKQFPIRAYRP